MRYLKKILLLIVFFYSSKGFCQVYQANPDEYKKSIKGGDPNGIYGRAAELCEQAAEKYDALGCSASAAYCRKMAAWNNCMVNTLAGSGNSCGDELLPENAPTCAAATIGGSNGSGNSSTNAISPIQELQQKEQQQQQELNNAQNASNSAYEQAINNNKKESGAIVDATLAGAQQLSDPKESLAYMGVGLTSALFVYSGERKEARAKEQERLENEKAEEQKAYEENEAKRLKALKADLDVNPGLFNFISSTTAYHISSFKGEHASNGALTAIDRMDLYDVNVRIEKVLNTNDSLFIYEVVRFKNLTDNKDSCIVSLTTVPFRKIDQVQAYNGDYTNSFNTENRDFKIFRYKTISNKSIKEAFTHLDDEGLDNKSYGEIQSGLTDVYITTNGNEILIRKKYVPDYNDMKKVDFSNILPAQTNRYMLVFGNTMTSPYDFVNDLNFVKN